jgi:hypothetical protein
MGKPQTELASRLVIAAISAPLSALGFQPLEKWGQPAFLTTGPEGRDFSRCKAFLIISVSREAEPRE